MGSFSVWHWLVLLLFLSSIYGIYRAIYAIYRSAKGGAPENNSSSVPSGVGGWLLLLVVGLMLLGPLMGAGLINSEIIAAESQYPNLLDSAEWGILKSAIWWSFLFFCCLSFYAGICLAFERSPLAVKLAKIILWIIGPVAYLFMGIFIPLVVFGEVGADPVQFIRGLISSVIVAAVWTAYLSKSKRVAATYGVSPAQVYTSKISAAADGKGDIGAMNSVGEPAAAVDLEPRKSNSNFTAGDDERCQKVRATAATRLSLTTPE